MKKLLSIIAFGMLFATTAFAQPAIWGGAKIKFQQGDTTFMRSAGDFKNWLGLSGGGTVSTVSVVTANGFAGTVANATTTPAITLTTGISGMLKGSASALVAATAGTDYVIPSGSVATLTTPRSIYGNNFDGSAALAQIIASNFGGTGNGFTKFTGPTTAERVFTLPDATATILTSNAAVTAAQGGTGQTAYAVGDILYASTTTALSKLADIATGSVLITGGVGVAPSYGKVGLTTHVSGILPGANGGTNNGFMDFTGPTTSTKTFTLPNASATILTSNAAVTVAQGGTGATTLTGVLFGNGTSAVTATALGGDNTLYGSNGTTPIFYTLGITTTSAAIGFSRSTGVMNLNLPDADASFRGTVSTGTQTFAGDKTYNGKVTGSGGIVGTSTASVAALNFNGVEDGKFRSVTATTTLDETDFRVYVGTLTADITLNLPACNATRDGWTYHFMKKGTDAFAFILDPNAAETFFDGASTKTYYSQGNTAHCQCENGLGWNLNR